MKNTKYHVEPRKHQRPFLRSPSSEFITELLRCASELLRRTSEVLTMETSVERLLLFKANLMNFTCLVTCFSRATVERISVGPPPNLFNTILIHVASSYWLSTLMDAYITWICMRNKMSSTHTHTLVRIFERNLPFPYCSWCSLIQSTLGYSIMFD